MKIFLSFKNGIQSNEMRIKDAEGKDVPAVLLTMEWRVNEPVRAIMALEEWNEQRRCFSRRLVETFDIEVER